MFPRSDSNVGRIEALEREVKFLRDRITELHGEVAKANNSCYVSLDKYPDLSVTSDYRRHERFEHVPVERVLRLLLTSLGRELRHTPAVPATTTVEIVPVPPLPTTRPYD